MTFTIKQKELKKLEEPTTQATPSETSITSQEKQTEGIKNETEQNNTLSMKT